MEAIDYCIDKVARQGTPGYYAVLFHPPPVRAALLALRTLEHELRDVVELCTDHDVAQHKLNYWQRELHAGNTSAPHPVTRALQQFANDALDEDARRQLLAGIAQRISCAQVRDESQIDQMSAASAGTIAQACAQVAQSKPAHAIAGAIAGAIEVAQATERLRLLSMPRRAGLPAHSGIALSTLTACAITPQQIDRAGNDPALIRLRASLLEQAFTAAQNADRLLGQRHGYLATCLRMTRCLLAASRRAGYARTGRLSQVAPLRLLWHAWRTKS